MRIIPCERALTHGRYGVCQPILHHHLCLVGSPSHSQVSQPFDDIFDNMALQQVTHVY